MTTPRLKRDWIGLRVKTVRDMETGVGILPAGSLAVVTDSYGGLRLRCNKCSQCGVRFTIRKVSENDVVIVERDEKETNERAWMRRRRVR